jgi:hypothetical protein
MTENTQSTIEKDAERDENIGVYRAKSVPLGADKRGRRMTRIEWCREHSQGEHLRYLAQRSWFCDPCKVEVYERRCPHCGKTERERT